MCAYFVKGGSNDGWDEIRWFHVASVAHFSVASAVVNHHRGWFHCVNCHNVSSKVAFLVFFVACQFFILFANPLLCVFITILKISTLFTSYK